MVKGYFLKIQKSDFPPPLIIAFKFVFFIGNEQNDAYTRGKTLFRKTRFVFDHLRRTLLFTFYQKNHFYHFFHFVPSFLEIYTAQSDFSLVKSDRIRAFSTKTSKSQMIVARDKIWLSVGGVLLNFHMCGIFF